MDNETAIAQLEFIVREYYQVTERLCEVFMELGDGETPPAIRAALDQLASAINRSW